MNNRIVKAGILLAALMQPAAAQERQWQLDAAEVDAYLLFGVPSTTDIGVSFWCKINSGEISVFAPLHAATKAPKTISLSINAAIYNLTATPSEDENSKTIEAKLLPQEKIFEELQSAERFTLTQNKHKVTYPLEGADLNGLLKLCTAK